MDDICEFLTETFPFYTVDMYEGNCPAGKTHWGADEWRTKFGGGVTLDGEILHFSFYLNEKISIFICKDFLKIVDHRYAGKPDIWVYHNKPFAISDTFTKKYRHVLESERIVKILNKNIPNCAIWEIVKKRAKELNTKNE